MGRPQGRLGLLGNCWETAGMQGRGLGTIQRSKSSPRAAHK